MRGHTNPFRIEPRAWRGLVLLAISLFLNFGTIASAQDSTPQFVEIYWQDSKVLAVPEVTSVTVLDESICRAEVSTDQIHFFGLVRGETAAFVWLKKQRLTLRVSVVAAPEKLPPPRLSQSALDALGHGVIGSSMQAFIDPQGNTDYFFLHHFEWQQQFDQNRLSIHGQVQDSTASGAPLFNTNSVSVQYTTPRTDLKLIDFPLFLNGGLEANVSSYSAYNVYTIRGADVTFHRGANEYEFFGGTTLPSYYLTLSGTRDIAGFNFSRTQSEKLHLYGTTGWVNAPFQVSTSQVQRENSFFQTTGFVYRPSLPWAVQGSLGGSTRGGLAQGVVSYTGENLTAFASGTSSAANFPLNQLQIFFAGGSSIAVGTTLRLNRHIGGSLYAQHSDTKATAFFPVGGKSDYLNPNLSFSFTPREAVTLNYTYTRDSSGLALLGRSQGHRLDALFNSRLGGGISNTAEITSGALSDPLQLNATGQFSARDSVTFPIRGSYLTVDFQHTNNNPSLVNRLNQEIGLLSPALQQLFLMDPLGFVDSPQLDPALRALLLNLQPTDTEVSVSGQFHIRNKLNLSPNVGYVLNAAGLGRNTNSKLFGYTLTYQITPTLQMISSLANVYLLDSQLTGVRRTTVITIGFNKSMRGTPEWLLAVHPHKRTIQGRVFSDLNVNGAYNTGEPGLPGVRVELSTGETVRTDSQGRFEFAGLAPNIYRVIVPLNQFTQAVRVTTPTDVRVDLINEKTAEVNFGIVNFARVIGNVFNDYRMDGKRQPDASGVRAIRLNFTGNGVNRKVVSDGAGDYELYGVPPGDYQLNLDRSTLPPNYVARSESVNIHVNPTATVVQDIPVQALRSVSGHVYFRPSSAVTPNGSTSGPQDLKPNGLPNRPSGTSKAGNATPQPLAGVRLIIDHTTVTTDAGGGFVLRNLPAGELTLTLIPTRSLPPGLAVPEGKLRLPLEPIQVENATIFISNPELLKYILPVSGAEK
jgi:hypothetical protein